jgi:hypothetical protein
VDLPQKDAIARGDQTLFFREKVTKFGGALSFYQVYESRWNKGQTHN